MIEQIKQHRVANVSIEKLNMDELMKGRKARVLYSDPPWSNGNLRYWTTIRKRHTGISDEPISYDELIAVLKNIITNYVDGYVFIEVSVKLEKEVMESFSEVLYNLKAVEVLYKAGDKLYPNLVVYGTTSPDYKYNLDIDPKNSFDVKLPSDCIKNIALLNEIVLDPCCGLGLTAQAAINNGMIFYGNEFNRKRLNETIRRLAK